MYILCYLFVGCIFCRCIRFTRFLVGREEIAIHYFLNFAEPSLQAVRAETMVEGLRRAYRFRGKSLSGVKLAGRDGLPKRVVLQ